VRTAVVAVQERERVDLRLEARCRRVREAAHHDRKAVGRAVSRAAPRRVALGAVGQERDLLAGLVDGRDGLRLGAPFQIGDTAERRPTVRWEAVHLGVVPLACTADALVDALLLGADELHGRLAQSTLTLE